MDAAPRDTTGRESVPSAPTEEEGRVGRQASPRGGFERFESSKSSSGYQPQQEGGRAGTNNPLASPGRDQREQPLEPLEPLELDKLEERFRKECRKTCRRNLFVELLNSTRKIDLLVLHCSDTRPDQDFTIEKLMRSHRNKGYGAYPGYHIYVRRDGTLFYCRPVAERGCHVKGYNTSSIGICYEGGHSCSPDVKYEDNRTAEQMVALDEVLRILHEIYPDARIVGHCELNPRKACPCLDPPASVEYQYIFQ